ncbi:hypothetical protein G9C98_004710 [Cotesia typhae]|uniref:Uncharacterized protein n=1 Tax=Cotesia typhae TaxID=2053667 RepID=A0A8J5QWU6_9HYME|nr:hypothetical protein G9C98_004710 [Cotesia typhae]
MFQISSWTNAYRSIYFTTTERRKEFRSKIEQTIHSNSANGHSSVHRDARGPPGDSIPQNNNNRSPKTPATVRLLADNSGERIAVLKNSFDGSEHQASALTGSIQHSLVLVFGTDEPPPSIFPPRNI